MLKVVMARGRRLKKGGGDLEAQKKNVASLEWIIEKQMLIHCNWDLRSKMLFHQN
jgi:hypothetical protein